MSRRVVRRIAAELANGRPQLGYMGQDVMSEVRKNPRAATAALVALAEGRSGLTDAADKAEIDAIIEGVRSVAGGGS